MSRAQENEINWFHPGVSREKAENILLNDYCEDGTFLIRECNSAVGDFVLTLLHQGKVCHYQIRRHGGDAFFSIDDKVKILHGLESLVEFYQMAKNGLPTKLTTFVKKDLPPNDARRHGSTNLLHRATKENNSTIVSELLKCGYRNVDAKNQDGQTALHLAAIHSDLDILKIILETDVNVNCIDAFGNMPLHYACRTKSYLFIRNLIEANANVQGRNIKNGYVPLHDASKHGNLEAIKELLESHAPLLARTTCGEFPIDLAQEAGQDAVVNFLSEYKLPAAKTKEILWYHGTLTRDEAVRTLKNFAKSMSVLPTEKMDDGKEVNDNIIDTSGCFLVRFSDRSGFVLTLLFEGQAKNFKIAQSSAYLYIDEGPYLPTLEHLVEHFMNFNDGLPVNLKYPVPPEPKPPQPLLSTLPRNKSKNKLLNFLKENSEILEVEPTTSVPNEQLTKKLPKKKRKETTNLVLTNFLKIKSKVSSPSDVRTSLFIESTMPQNMLEEFPCKGLSFAANFLSDTIEMESPLTSLNADFPSKSLKDTYNVPKNNSAIGAEAGGLSINLQGTKCHTKNGFSGSLTKGYCIPRCDERDNRNFVDDQDSVLQNSNIAEDIPEETPAHTAKTPLKCFEWLHTFSNSDFLDGDFTMDSFIPYENIELGNLIGEGEFGSVYHGHLKKRRYTEIAIKTLHEGHCPASKYDFLREASVMMRLNHHCIVQFIGLSKGDNFMMVQEFVPLGSMLRFIQQNPTKIDPNRELKLWSSQIACGMLYLETQHFVHRDLAARNILLSSFHQAKISDFGLSRALASDNDFYEAQHGGKWPIKWYAPESYKNGIFSHSSDVWSYGITLWEMFSLGEAPYGEMLGSEVVQLIEDGKRLLQPTTCPANFFSIMENCWQYNPKDRPSFGFLMEFFIKDPNYQNIMELVKTRSIS